MYRQRIQFPDKDLGLREDVHALGAAYLGGFSFAQLALGGGVTELHPGAIEQVGRGGLA